MSDDKPWPCKLTEDGHIEPCHGLSSVLDDPFGRGTRQQGVSIRTLVNRETRQFSRDVVVVKSGEYSKKGLVANVCPICGGALVKPEPEDVKANESEPASPGTGTDP